MIGLSDVIGSWKIMLIDWPRSFRMTRSGACATSTPVTINEPAMRSRPGGRSRIAALAMVVLPEPLSPIRAKNSPRATRKLTSSTIFSSVLS